MMTEECVIARDFYVYAWLRACGTPFYIGKGRGRRDTATKRNRLFSNVVRKIKRNGEDPRVIRIRENLSEQEAFEVERDEIAKYGRRNNNTGILTNLTDGGDGTSGLYVSDETRQKMSAARIGKTASDKSRIRMSESASNRSLEHRKNLSVSLTGKKKSEESRKKNSASHKGKRHDQETLTKMRASHISLPPRSGFKGVYQKRKKWQARIKIGGKMSNLGTFTLPEDAARAYDAAALSAWGNGCYVNFPQAVAKEGRA